MIYQPVNKVKEDRFYDTVAGGYMKNPLYVFIDAYGRREEVDILTTYVFFGEHDSTKVFKPKTMRREDVRVIEGYNVFFVSLFGLNENAREEEKGFCYNKNVEFHLYNCGKVNISCRNNIIVNSCGTVALSRSFIGSEYEYNDKQLNNVTIKKCGYLEFDFFDTEQNKKSLKKFKKNFSDIFCTGVDLSESEIKEFNTKHLCMRESIDTSNGLEKIVQDIAKKYDCFCFHFNKNYKFSGSDTITNISVPGYKVVILRATVSTDTSRQSVILIYKNTKVLKKFMENSPAIVSNSYNIFSAPESSKLGAYIEWIRYPAYEFQIVTTLGLSEIFFPRLKGFKNYLSGNTMATFIGGALPPYPSNYSPEYDFSSLEVAYLPPDLFNYNSLVFPNIKKIRCKREMAKFLTQRFEKWNSSPYATTENAKVKIENITWEYTN